MKIKTVINLHLLSLHIWLSIYLTALLKLSTPAKLSTWVNAICLPDDNISFRAGKSCHIAGWGHTQWSGSQPDTLREAVVQLVSRDVCNSPVSYAGKIHDRAICAGRETGGKCALKTFITKIFRVS